MPVIPCLKSENQCNPCAGDSSNPLANLSSEAPDINIWTSVQFRRVVNVVPNLWTRDTCVGFCESSLSQTDADDCAERRAVECVPDPPFADPPPFAPPIIPTLFCNQEIAAQSGASCYTIPACTVFRSSQGEANAIAESLANSRVFNAVLSTPCAPIIPPPAPEPEPEPEPPLDTTCGVPLFRISGYGPAIAQSIVDLMPSSIDSPLPEWDGVFRDDGTTGLRSHVECYSILGKEIELFPILNSTAIQEINCNFGGNPGFWNPTGVGDCAFCNDNLVFTYFSTDLITASNGLLDPHRDFVNQGMGGVGAFRLYTGPSCLTTTGPHENFHVTGDVALGTIGSVYFNVAAVP